VRRLAIVAGVLLAAFSAYPMVGQWTEFPDSFFTLLLWPQPAPGWMAQRASRRRSHLVTKDFFIGPE
jgi:hypothetical protein